MQLHTGAFGSFHPDGRLREVFAARVLIPQGEFARLGLGDHERPGAAPACFRWCVAAFGPGGARWAVRLPDDDLGDAVVYFAAHAAAAAFLARWAAAAAAAAAPERRLAA
jgi:hypothetical protein